jgi:hypothetical protein
MCGCVQAFLQSALGSDVPFGLSVSDAVAASLGVTAPAIVMFSEFDEGRADFDGSSSGSSFNSAAIDRFVWTYSLPSVVVFSEKVRVGLSRLRPASVCFDVLCVCVGTTVWVRVYMRACAQASPVIFKSKVNEQLFVFVDDESDEGSAIVVDVAAVAKKLRGKMTVVTVSPDAGNNKFLEYIGVGASECIMCSRCLQMSC